MEFELNFCKECVRMTNHYPDGNCAKCKMRDGIKLVCNCGKKGVHTCNKLKIVRISPKP